MTGQRDPSYVDLVYDVLRSARQPLTFDEIFDEVSQAIWPSFLEIQKRQDRRPVRARLSNGAETWLSLDFIGTGTWGSPMPEPLRQLLIDRRAAAGDSLLIRVVGSSTNGGETNR